MFEFIKRLFKKEEVLTIDRESLAAWFRDKVRDAETELKERYDSIRNEVKSRIQNTREKVRILEEAKLINPNISTKELQFMNGNRKFYTDRTNILLKQIEDILSHEPNFVLQNYSDFINGFAQSTARAFRILHEFFENEVRQVANSVKEIDEAVAHLKNDPKIKRYNAIEKIMKELHFLENKAKKKQELAEIIEKLKNELVLIKSDEERSLSKKEEILKSNEYKLLLSFMDKKKNTEDEIEKLKAELYSFFSILERPLRKYERMSLEHGKLIEHYSVDALNALMTDYNYKILDILEGLAKNLTAGKLGFKGKEAQKIVDTVARLDKNFFVDFVKRYTNALTHKERLDKEIREHKINEEMAGIAERLDDLKIKEEGLISRVRSQESELNSVDFIAMQENILLEMQDVLKMKLRFI